MRKRGVTLIELVVAMAIFTIIVLVVVGAFITVIRTRTLTGNMRESQQKIRIAEEVMVRLARQADFVTISSDQKELTLYFRETKKVEKFSIIAPVEADARLLRNSCQAQSLSSETGSFACAFSGSGAVLIGGSSVKLDGSSNFSFSADSLSPSPSPALNIILNGKIEGIGAYYRDNFNINTSVILENMNK